jgi:chemotaxis protein CheD
VTALREKLVNVIQGEYAISNDADTVLTTVLGSCVSVCMCDPVHKIGGMNHFLLANKQGQPVADVRYGAYALELLINGLLKKGAARERLQAKVFGGASMIGGMRDIGASNAAFAKKFLADEGVPCLAESVGGTSARRIRFWPTSGNVKQLLVQGNLDTVAPVKAPPPVKKPTADITLF